MDDDTWKLGFLDTQIPAMTLHLHERKFEIDSLLYVQVIFIIGSRSVIKLSHMYYNATGDVEVFHQEHWKNAMFSIIEVLKVQQKASDVDLVRYFFQRSALSPLDTLLWGVGPPAKR